jgi:XTP/dITP diphosphohydrolase
MEIVIGSNNLHKIREIRLMFKSLKNIDLLSLLNFPEFVPEEEPEVGTLKDIAVAKAERAAKALNKWVLADDSGLFVPALGGAPGIKSRRYACDDATDSENRKKLLSEMQDFNDLQRSAYFECCLALASPEKLIKCVVGTCQGHIALEETGRNGFGYDSIFIKNEYNKSFGELEESHKNRISHRWKAFEKLLPTLETSVH